MKKSLFTILLGIISLVAFAQQPTNLGWVTNSTPPYAPVGTFASVSASYIKAAVPASGHDTLRIGTNTNIANYEFDSVNGNKTSPFVIMADTTGDTASYSNYPTGKATVWYKKNPFLMNHQLDEINFLFHGNLTSYSTVKFGAMFVGTGLNAQDTLHIAIFSKTAKTGGALAKFKYDYYINRWVYAGSSTW